jgi:hypothetical protein
MEIALLKQHTHRHGAQRCRRGSGSCTHQVRAVAPEVAERNIVQQVQIPGGCLLVRGKERLAQAVQLQGNYSGVANGRVDDLLADCCPAHGPEQSEAALQVRRQDL